MSNLKTSISQKKEYIIENFHGGSITGSNSSNLKLHSDPEESSITSQYKCAKRNMDEKPLYSVGSASDAIGGRRKKKSFLIGPSEDQNSSYSIFNPIWLLLPIINLVIDIIMDIMSIFTWFIKILFMETYKMIVPSVTNTLLSGSGIRDGKKYCIGLSIFRYFIIILCPPAGVFMAYGFSGWLQILICCIASLMYYFPGLVYALILVNRSDVADYIKKSKSNDCNDSGLLGGLFVGDQDNVPQCAAELGEECTSEGKNLIGGNPRRKDCCANPVLGSDGTYTINGKAAMDHESKPITTVEQGEIYCRNDFKKIKMGKGMCVWKATKKP